MAAHHHEVVLAGILARDFHHQQAAALLRVVSTDGESAGRMPRREHAIVHHIAKRRAEARELAARIDEDIRAAQRPVENQRAAVDRGVARIGAGGGERDAAGMDLREPARTAEDAGERRVGAGGIHDHPGPRQRGVVRKNRGRNRAQRAAAKDELRGGERGRGADLERAGAPHRGQQRAHCAAVADGQQAGAGDADIETAGDRPRRTGVRDFGCTAGAGVRAEDRVATGHRRAALGDLQPAESAVAEDDVVGADPFRAGPLHLRHTAPCRAVAEKGVDVGDGAAVAHHEMALAARADGEIARDRPRRADAEGARPAQRAGVFTDDAGGARDLAAVNRAGGSLAVQARGQLPGHRPCRARALDQRRAAARGIPADRGGQTRQAATRFDVQLGIATLPEDQLAGIGPQRPRAGDEHLAAAARALADRTEIVCLAPAGFDRELAAAGIADDQRSRVRQERVQARDGDVAHAGRFPPDRRHECSDLAGGLNPQRARAQRSDRQVVPQDPRRSNAGHRRRPGAPKVATDKAFAADHHVAVIFNPQNSRARAAHFQVARDRPLRRRAIDRGRSVAPRDMAEAAVVTGDFAGARDEQGASAGIADRESAGVGPGRATAGHGGVADGTRLVTDGGSACDHIAVIGNEQRAGTARADRQEAGRPGGAGIGDRHAAGGTRALPHIGAGILKLSAVAQRERAQPEIGDHRGLDVQPFRCRPIHDHGRLRVGEDAGIDEKTLGLDFSTQAQLDLPLQDFHVAHENVAAAQVEHIVADAGFG